MKKIQEQTLIYAKLYPLNDNGINNICKKIKIELQNHCNIEQIDCRWFYVGGKVNILITKHKKVYKLAQEIIQNKMPFWILKEIKNKDSIYNDWYVGLHECLPIPSSYKKNDIIYNIRIFLENACFKYGYRVRTILDNN